MTEPAPAAPAPAAKPAAPAKAAPAQQAAPATGPLSPAEQETLSALLARQSAAAAGGTGDPVRMKVEGDHVSLTYGGLTVGTEFTTVPPALVAAFVEAAADAGVTLTQES